MADDEPVTHGSNQPGEPEERTFESTLVIAIRNYCGRQPKAGAPKSASPAPTAEIRKRKPAKTSGGGNPTTFQAGNSKERNFELATQLHCRANKASAPRKRKDPPRRGNTEQRTLPGLSASSNESKA